MNHPNEILSPDQKQMMVTRKILHSLRHGGEMGWLVDPEERVVLVYQRDRLPDECVGDMILPCLDDMDWHLTVNELFS